MALAQLAGPARALLARAAAVAVAHGSAPYLVGGSVRDLLLGRMTIDLDVVIVGAAIAVARALREALGGPPAARLSVHEAFGTATLLPPDGPPLDLITARRETYAAPGALPTVVPGTLDDDLRRRDFTINAIALSLGPDDFGVIHDPLGGRGDLAAGIVRVLHAASFRDDPTRLLRAIRYAGRLGFAFDAETAALFLAALAARAFATVSVQRLSHEFARVLAEPRAAAMLDRLARTGALAQLAPPLDWGETERVGFARLDALWSPALVAPPRPVSRWEARFALLTAALAPAAARAAATALVLPGRTGELAGQVAELRAVLAEMPLPGTPAALGRRLDRYEPAAILTVAARTPEEGARARLLRYLTAVRAVAPILTGEALRALGVAPGPIYREALAALRDFKRDRPAATVADERDALRAWLAGHGH